MNTIRTTIPPQPTRLLDQLRLHICQQGLAYRTEQTYIHWTRRFINFHNKQHPKDCAQRAGIRVQTFFWCRGRPAFARRYRRLPVVYSREEIAAILSKLRGVYRVQVELLYGTGLRLAELLSLRIKDIDFGSNNIIVRNGKGSYLK